MTALDREGSVLGWRRSAFGWRGSAFGWRQGSAFGGREGSAFGLRGDLCFVGTLPLERGGWSAFGHRGVLH